MNSTLKNVEKWTKKVDALLDCSSFFDARVQTED